MKDPIMDRLERKRQRIRALLADADGIAQQGRLTAGQVMTVWPSCISPETTAWELIKLFHEKQFRHLLVTDGEGHLVGVISDRDVLRCLGPERYPDAQALQGINAEQLMSTDLVTIEPRTLVDKAAVMMVEQGISCLPVMNGGHLLGILTNTDLHLVLEVMLQTLRTGLLEQSVATSTASPQN